jgi:hypothetical protein
MPIGCIGHPITVHLVLSRGSRGGLPLALPSASRAGWSIAEGEGSVSVPVGALVVIAKEEFAVGTEGPFVFGRADAEDVVGLNPRTLASRRRPGREVRRGPVVGGEPQPQASATRRRRRRRRPPPAPRQRQAPCINVLRLNVLVPGVIYTRRLEVLVSVEDLPRFHHHRPPSGTLTGEISLSEHDRDAVVALLSGYLEGFPRREARPRTYQQAADLLGAPWTKTAVRKQIEHLTRVPWVRIPLPPPWSGLFRYCAACVRDANRLTKSSSGGKALSAWVASVLAAVRAR